MKVAQYYDHDHIRLALIEGDSLVPLDFKGDMIDLITEKPDLKASSIPIPLEQVRFAPAVSHPTKIIGIGLNYMDHVQESKGKVPAAPILFAKFPNTLIGHKDRITWSLDVTRKVDFEAELAVIIGRKAYRCGEGEVMEAVFGYTCANDVSARDLQFSDGQWVRGKSLDTFCPLGPWIVTREEIHDPHSLAIRCVVNATTMQESNTARMIFRLPALISFLSMSLTLHPGDVILTGTPHGVGAFRQPSVYLQDGDEVLVEVEKVGRLVNTCKVLGNA